MSSENTLPVGRKRKQRHVIDPFGVTSSVMAPIRPQTYRNTLMCDFCGNRYEKHYIMKHLQSCMKKIGSKQLRNRDIRYYICWLNIVISHVVILTTRNKCIDDPINVSICLYPLIDPLVVMGVCNRSSENRHLSSKVVIYPLVSNSPKSSNREEKNCFQRWRRQKIDSEKLSL